MKRFKIFLLAFFLLAGVYAAHTTIAHAQGGCTDANDVLGIDCGQATGLTAEDPRILTVRIINFALTFLGIIGVCIVLYAGFTWMTAGGNDEQVGNAKKMLISAIIGLVIIMVSYSITSYIIWALCDTTGSCGPGF